MPEDHFGLGGPIPNSTIWVAPVERAKGRGSNSIISHGVLHGVTALSHGLNKQYLGEDRQTPSVPSVARQTDTISAVGSKTDRHRKAVPSVAHEADGNPLPRLREL